MREWNLKSEDPLSLTLAADARLGPTNYCDDQIWRLQLGGGEPPALALQTTYGLRARSLRLFPRFVEGDLAQTDPASYPRPPVVHQFYPNYARIDFSPLPDIDVQAEYWVPQSQAVAGRLRFSNQGNIARQLRLDWVALLSPNQGQRMAPVEMDAAPVLSGASEDLAPIVFLTGGPQTGSGPYPALNLSLELQPGGSRTLTWSHAALSTPEESFALARSVAARPWEAEIARLELLNGGQIEIYTGEPDWDLAFALTQRLAYGLFVGPTENLPAASFVLTRQPDHGHSIRGDGSDYNYLWDGQTPLEAYYLAEMILPSAPRLAQGLLRNFLATQTEDGFVDWKPGLSGQKSRLLATPILASLAWRIYQQSEDRDFLEETFPKLLRFVQSWFTRERDRDEDGVPEWDHPMQMGFDDHPVFSRWHDWAQGVDISTAESPALCAFLYRECQTLIKMAGLLEQGEAVPALQSLADHLRTALETSWNEELATYTYWDRDTHQSPQGEPIGEFLGSGKFPVQKSFEEPARLHIRIQTEGETTRRPEIFVHGESVSGQHRVEHVPGDRFRWYLGTGTLTGERVYSRLEMIEVKGLDDKDRITFSRVGFCCQDHTVLLPLWSGVLNAERAEILVRQTIGEPAMYWRPYGIPACPSAPYEAEVSVCRAAHMIWNQLIGEGLLAYGYQAEAAELVTRLMLAAIQSLKQAGGFRRYYHVDTGQGTGEHNILGGLPPLGLFLETLGVRLIGPQKVALQGFNPFPWPVTVKYRGLTVLRQKDKTMVIFPDGQTVVVDDPAPQIVSLEIERVRTRERA